MPPSLEDLPRELRQHIFSLAFTYAAAQDSRLNELIRTCIRRHDGMLRLEYNFIPTWTAVLEKECTEWANVHAPHIHDLTTTLSATYLDLQDDVDYVLERSLKAFKEEQEKIMSTIARKIALGDEEDAEGYEAIDESGRRAKARGERHDMGDNAGVHEMVMIGSMASNIGEEAWELLGWGFMNTSPWEKFGALRYQQFAWTFHRECQ